MRLWGTIAAAVLVLAGCGGEGDPQVSTLVDTTVNSVQATGMWSGTFNSTTDGHVEQVTLLVDGQGNSFLFSKGGGEGRYVLTGLVSNDSIKMKAHVGRTTDHVIYYDKGDSFTAEFNVRDKLEITGSYHHKTAIEDRGNVYLYYTTLSAGTMPSKVWWSTPSWAVCGKDGGYDLLCLEVVDVKVDETGKLYGTYSTSDLYQGFDPPGSNQLIEFDGRVTPVEGVPGIYSVEFQFGTGSYKGVGYGDGDILYLVAKDSNSWVISLMGR